MSGSVVTGWEGGGGKERRKEECRSATIAQCRHRRKRRGRQMGTGGVGGALVPTSSEFSAGLGGAVAVNVF